MLASLTNVSTTLRSQASAFGSNLSIVQIRQDFSKNLINVLQTGSSNLTLADTNEEAANSQALATRQSIAVSAGSPWPTSRSRAFSSSCAKSRRHQHEPGAAGETPPPFPFGARATPARFRSEEKNNEFH